MTPAQAAVKIRERSIAVAHATAAFRERGATGNGCRPSDLYVSSAENADMDRALRRNGLPVQLRHLGNLLGFLQTEIGTLNQVIHLWGFDDLDDRQRRRAEMAKDPAWHEFMRRNEELPRCCIRKAGS